MAGCLNKMGENMFVLVLSLSHFLAYLSFRNPMGCHLDIERGIYQVYFS